MHAYKDMVREYSYTTGTGALTLAGAVPGYVSFENAGIINGQTVYYEIKNGTAIEHGVGTWGTGGILTRTTPDYTLTSAGVVDDTSPTALTLVGTSEVMISVTSKFIDDIFAKPEAIGGTIPAAATFTTETIGSTAISGSALSTTLAAKLTVANSTYTDSSTSASGTVAHGTVVSIDNPAIASTNATVTYTNASTLYIDGAPTNGTNVTITNPYAMYIAGGVSYFGGAISYGGVTLSNSVTGTGSMALSASPTFTGTPAAPTAAAATNTTQLATCAFVRTEYAAPPAIGNTTPAAGTFTTLTSNTDVVVSKTITAPATVGAQTINKTAGSVNFAAAAVSLVVTNSLVSTSSVIIATVATNDATMLSVQAVAGSGSFTLYANAAATAETRVNFIVVN